MTHEISNTSVIGSVFAAFTRKRWFRDWQSVSSSDRPSVETSELQDAAGYLKRGVKLVSEKQFEQAIAEFDKAILLSNRR